MNRIYRYEVPVDDTLHSFSLWGDPLAVGCRDTYVVEFWAEYSDNHPNKIRPRTFFTVGTGHEIMYPFKYWGVAVAPGGLLVWHLLELLDSRPGLVVDRTQALAAA